MGEKKRGLSVKAVGSMLLSGAMIYVVTTPSPLILNWPEDPNTDVPVAAFMCESDLMGPPKGHSSDVFLEEDAFTLIDINSPFDVVSTYRPESQGLPLYSYGKDNLQDTLPEQTWQNPTILAPLSSEIVTVNGEILAQQDSEADGAIAALMEANGFEEVPHDGALYENVTTWIEPIKYEARLGYHDIDTYVQVVNALQRGRGTKIISPFSGDDPLNEQLVDRWLFPGYYFFERYKPGEYDVFLEVSQADGRVFKKGECTFHLQTGPRITTLTRNGDTVVDVTIDYGSHTEDILTGEVALDDLADRLTLYDEIGRPYLFSPEFSTSQLGATEIRALWLAPVHLTKNLSYLELLALNGISDPSKASLPEQHSVSLVQGETNVGVNPNKLEGYLSSRMFYQYAAELRGQPIANLRVGVIIIDPQGPDGVRVHEQYGWKEPDELIDEFITSLEEVSHGNAIYDIVLELEYEGFPTSKKGEAWDWKSYRHCIKGNDPACKSHSPLAPTNDNTLFFEEISICDLVWEHNLSEIWVMGGPWMGFGEYAITGPTLTRFNGGDYNTPSCGRTVVMFGFNYERDIACMLEVYGHRIEGMMIEKYDGWNAGDINGTDWDVFTVADLDAAGQAQCGRVHFPPNAVDDDYQWSKNRYVLSNCDAWQHYPDLPEGMEREMNCEEWDCSHSGFQEWWLSHIPQDDRLGSESNWWRYILRPDAPD